MTTIAFAGGGTGGHLTPAIAIAERLPASVRPLFIGCGRPIERAMLSDVASRYRPLSDDAGRGGRTPFQRLQRQRTAVREAANILHSESVAAVVGLGGYASVPTVMAAAKLGLPITLLEQNAVAGRATELLAPLARRVLASMPLIDPISRTEVVGNPVRASLLAVPAIPSAPSILVLGGSQGAAALNRTLPPLLTGCEVVHQCGRGSDDETEAAYGESPATVVELIDDMPAALANASIVISRAGATTLAELAVTRRPTILIPYPGSVRDHQDTNAAWARRHGGVDVVRESDLAAELPGILAPLLRDARLRNWRSQQIARIARPDAADDCVSYLLRDLGTSRRHAA